MFISFLFFFFFFQAEDGIRDHCVTGVQTCALPISSSGLRPVAGGRWSIDASRWRPTGEVRGSIVKPTILAVLDDPRDWQAIHLDLTSRYATDYEIICESSPLRALQRLDALRAASDAIVLIVLAAGQMAAMTGTEFLQQAHELHPHAKRVLLIPWSNRSTSKPVLRMISQGRFDRYANVPARSPDENLHLLVTEILRDWQQQHPDRPTVVTLIDEPWSPRSYHT